MPTVLRSAAPVNREEGALFDAEAEAPPELEPVAAATEDGITGTEEAETTIEEEEEEGAGLLEEEEEAMTGMLAKVLGLAGAVAIAEDVAAAAAEEASEEHLGHLVVTNVAVE